jgi:hypothetical protein
LGIGIGEEDPTYNIWRRKSLNGIEFKRGKVNEHAGVIVSLSMMMMQSEAN